MDKFDLQFYANEYYVNDYDVPFELERGGELLVKPIKVKDIPKYNWAKSILAIDKTRLNDIEIIQMSYLKFLTTRLFKEDTSHESENQLRYIIYLCFGYDMCAFTYEMKNNKQRPIIALCDEKGKIEKIINQNEFDILIKIILSQNDPTYDDSYVDPEIKDMLADLYASKYKDVHSPTLEEMKGYVASKISKTFKELNEISYREFQLIYDALVQNDMYIADKIIQASPKYEVKDSVMHPLFKPRKDPYDELFVGVDVLQNKGIVGADALNDIK